MDWIIIRRCGSALTYATFVSIYYNFLLDARDFDLSTIALVYSVLLLSNQIFAFPAGLLGDRFGLKTLMLAGCALDAISYFALVFGNGTVWVYLAALGIGIGGCLFSTNARAELLLHSNGDKHLAARLQGRFLRWTNVGSLLGPVFGIIILRHGWFTQALLAIGCLELLLSLPLLIDWMRTADHRRARKISDDASHAHSYVPFVKIHLWAAIPVGLAASAPLVFPFVFSSVLHMPADNSTAQFIRSLVVIILQGWISSTLLTKTRIQETLLISMTLMVLLICLAVGVSSTFPVIVISAAFGICQVAATTALYNGIIVIETPWGQATSFGISKLLLAASTFVVLKTITTGMNLLEAGQLMNADGLFYFVLVGALLASALMIRVLSPVRTNANNQSAG